MWISFVLWMAAWVLGYSFIEHFFHRFAMHRKSVVHRWLPYIHDHHVPLHHRRYYKVFNHEPDPVGRRINLRFEVLPSLPVILVVAALIHPFSGMGAFCALLSTLIHHLFWNAVHCEMHDPQGRFFSQWRIQRYLARYHWMHHRYPGKNYNVTIPIADILLGKRMKPSDRDVQAMEAIGL